MTWSNDPAEPARQFRARRVPGAGIQKPTSCRTPHHRKRRMSNKVYTLATRRILWNRKAHNKVSAISRSKNKTDGSPSPMVGCVSYPPLAPSPSSDLLVSCVTLLRVCVVDYGIVRIQSVPSDSDLFATPPHSFASTSLPAMICIPAPTLVGPALYEPLSTHHVLF